LRPVSYGSEEITNGGFDTDSGWVKSTTPATTIASGEATVGGTGGNGYIYQDAGLTVGTLYQISFDVTSAHSSSLTFLKGSDFGSTSGSYKALGLLTTGTHVVNFVATSEFIGLTVGGGNSAVIVIDNVSVKEVTFDESDGTLTLFEHPDNIPRVEYDADGNRLGLLVEESRTNLFPYSVLDDAHWFRSSASIDENQITAPDGTNTGSNFIADSGSSLSFINIDTSITSGTTYTQSIFAKAKDTSWIQIAPSTGFSSAYQNFNLQTGSLGASDNITSASITDVGNGWYRCSATVTATSTQSGRMVFGWIGGDDGRLDTDGSFTPDGTQGVYVWGAQLEEGAFPTSYIKTTGSTATRSADVASIPVADFGYNTSVGSIVAEVGAHNTDSNAAAHYTMSKTTTGLEWVSVYSSSANVAFRVREGGSDQGVITISNDIRTSGAKTGFAFKEDDFAAVVNGGSVSTDTSGSMASGIEELKIAMFASNPRQLCGYIKSIKYYPRRLTNAQLQDLTT
jgi:hypothetical protein